MASERYTRQAILIRLAGSLAVVTIALVLVLVTYFSKIEPKLSESLENISCGLIVLGLAGIWVSYFAERQAGKEIGRNVEDRFSIVTATLDAGITRLYPNRDNPGLKDAILGEMKKTRGPIKILAIAAREFFHQGQDIVWSAYGTINSLAKERDIRVLLLHPWCEQAVSRALREDPQHNTFDRYQDTRLFQDVMRSCDTLDEWRKSGSKVEARLYKVMPGCFVIMTNEVLFVEPYHFGTGGRASGKVPVIEAWKGSKLYDQFEGHFEYVWTSASHFALQGDFVKHLRERSNEECIEFERAVRFSRPDLFTSPT